MILRERAKALKTEVANMIASPLGAMIPPQVRAILAMQSDFLIALAEHVDQLDDSRPPSSFISTVPRREPDA